MTYFLILTLFLLLTSPDFSRSTRPDSLSHERLMPWKGLCVLLILLSHYTGYIETVPSDETYLLIRSGMGQTVVVLFFFAAGYGMTLQLTQRRKSYLTHILKKSLNLWLLCALSVGCMLLVQLLRGRSYDLYTVLLAFVPLVSLGNSPWFIFAILLCYLCFFLCSLPYAFRPGRWTLLLMVFIQTLLTLGYISILTALEFDDYWYDTIILFPVGMLAGTLKTLIPGKKTHEMTGWLTALTVSAATVCYLHCYHTRSFLLHELYVVSACALLIVLALRWTPGSRLLRFLGEHAMVIYLFQRIPMILFYETGLLDMVPHLAFFPVFCCMLLASALQDRLRKRFRQQKIKHKEMA